MRTTLDIDNDVLNAAKELARRENMSAGQVVSRLLRSALTGQAPGVPQTETGITVAGFRPFGPRGQVVSDGEINALRDQEGI
ncbi:MAG: hypothetical protein C3F19_14515 [Rhodocyclales bacterium]|jgi:hypothetical protein|nr:MAG: hypothetical protein C3F19_14515 [Rhodocyclales bacterium]